MAAGAALQTFSWAAKFGPGEGGREFARQLTLWVRGAASSGLPGGGTFVPALGLLVVACRENSPGWLAGWQAEFGCICGWSEQASERERICVPACEGSTCLQHPNQPKKGRHGIMALPKLSFFWKVPVLPLCTDHAGKRNGHRWALLLRLLLPLPRAGLIPFVRFPFASCKQLEKFAQAEPLEDPAASPHTARMRTHSLFSVQVCQDPWPFVLVTFIKAYAHGWHFFPLGDKTG